MNAIILLIIVLESVRQWKKSRQGRRRLVLIAALALALVAPPKKEQRERIPTPIDFGRPAEPPYAEARPDGGAEDGAPHSMIATEESVRYAGEPLAEGCSPLTDPLVTECHPTGTP